MSLNVIQPSFSAGELSPTLYARVDLAKYHSGARLMLNFFVDYRGGASTRTGTRYVIQCRSGTDITHLIPFVFNTQQTYELEIGDGYIRPLRDGAPLLENGVGITGITKANPGVVTSTAHAFASDNWVVLSDITGMTELNGLTVQIGNVTANTYELFDLNGDPINTSSFTTYVGGGIAERIFEVSSPYASADIPLIKYAQSADIMTLVHPDYPIYELRRNDETDWDLVAVTIGSALTAPTGLVGTKSSAGKSSFAYLVTSVDNDKDESIASTVADVTLSVDIGAVAGNIKLTWTAVTGAAYYNVYKASPVAATSVAVPAGVNFGFVGDSSTGAFTDSNIIPDFTQSPPLNTNPFSGGNNPGVVVYYQQRRVFAASTDEPENLWFSKPGLGSNFDVSNPVRPDDAITETLSSLQVNAVKYMIGMPGGLVVLTSGSAWQVSGGSLGDAVTPTTIRAAPQAYNGCADILPIPIGYNILYVQERGSVVRDLSYNFYTNIYTGADISVLSNHLFHGFTIADWCWAEEPFKMVWTVRSDGRCMSLTYLKEQEVAGWAQHETKGLFKSTSSVQEGNTNAVYFIVQRFINGRTVQFVERMMERTFPYGSEDAWCLDCALQNTLTYPDAGLTPSASTGSGVTFTADAPVFVSGDVAKVLRVGGGIATITAFTSAFVLVGTFTRDMTNVLPQDDDETPIPALSGEWSLTAKVTEVTGLNHLEGQVVGILADGNVLDDQVVTGGGVALVAGGASFSASKVIVGLRYTAKFQTLDLDLSSGESTVQGKRKKLAALTARVTETRGLSFGSTFETLKPFKMRTTEPMGQPIELMTGDQYIVMDPSWNIEGRICIQQDYPLPATVLGVIPEVVIGDGGVRGR